MATVLITGGTGMIGKKLSAMLLQKGYDVIIVTRKAINENTQPHIFYAQWNVNEAWMDKEAFAKADYIIHLAGAGVAEKRWTKKRKQEIVNSRTKSSSLIASSLKTIPNKVKAVISASAIGWYGADAQLSQHKKFTEADLPANDFLGNTCKQWEESIKPVTELGKRLVILRTGIVLSNDGGAYAEFKKPIKKGFAAILGSGKQVISWIHIEDTCRMYIYALENEQLNGIYNAVAPAPVTNKDFTLQLAKLMRGKYFIPVYAPQFVLRLMLGEMSVEVLKSTSVSSDKIHNAGFTFLYPSLEPALRELIKK